MSTPGQTRILCINCNTRLNKNTLHRIRHRLVFDLDTKLISLLNEWISPITITNKDYICESCNGQLDRYLNKHKNSQSSRSSQRGHRQVCKLCGRSINNRQSHFVNNNSSNEQKQILAFVRSKLKPRELSSHDKICHSCWINCKRAARRTQKIDYIRRVDETNDDTVTVNSPVIRSVKVPAKIVPSRIAREKYRRATNTGIEEADDDTVAANNTDIQSVKAKGKILPSHITLEKYRPAINTGIEKTNDDTVVANSPVVQNIKGPAKIVLTDHSRSIDGICRVEVADDIIHASTCPIIQSVKAPTQIVPPHVTLEKCIRASNTGIEVDDDTDTTSSPVNKIVRTVAQKVTSYYTCKIDCIRRVEAPEDDTITATSPVNRTVKAPAKIVPPHITLEKYRRAANTASRCLFPHCRNVNLHLISDAFRAIVLSLHKYYIPMLARVCTEHQHSKEWCSLYGSSNSYTKFTPQQVEHVFSFVNACKPQLNFSDIQSIQEIDESVFFFFTGKSKQYLFKLLDTVPRIREMHNGILGLAASLMKIKTGETDVRLSMLLDVPLSTLESLMKKCKELLSEDLVNLKKKKSTTEKNPPKCIINC